MSVPQYLRPGNLVDAVKGHLTPDFVRNASSLTGEPETSTRRALDSATPSLLGGILNMASTNEGASKLSNTIHEGGFASAIDGSSLFSGGGATKMMDTGRGLLGSIFGNQGSVVSESIAQNSGIKPSSATSLLSLAAPLTLGVVGKEAIAQGANSPSGLSNMLMGQKEHITAALPSGMSRLLGFSGGPVLVPSTAPEAHETTTARDTRTASDLDRSVYTQETPRRAFGWVWLVLLGLLALGVFMLMRGRTPQTPGQVGQAIGGAANQAESAVKGAANSAMATLNLPGGANLSVPQGSPTYGLAQFLASGSAQEMPKAFVFNQLTFATTSSQLTPEATQAVGDLASVLKAYPNARIQISGYTDNTGTPQANQALSLDRANSVRDALINDGVAADRITAQGFGQNNPIASNDTDAGKAQNRRIEVAVTQK